jgi:hypothetical protein
MIIKVMKWLSVAALAVAALLPPEVSAQRVLLFVVCAGSLAVIAQAVRAERPYWTTAFVGIAVLFNPVMPNLLPTSSFFWLDLAGVFAFALSAFRLQGEPIFSIQSITERTPGRESL